jgi:predicted RNase H-like HicB family nuclease
MKKIILSYNVIIRKEDKDYIAYVPTLGISDFGKTLESAQKNVKDAIACHIEGLKKSSEEIPTPDSTNYFISQVSVPFLWSN